MIGLYFSSKLSLCDETVNEHFCFLVFIHVIVPACIGIKQRSFHVISRPSCFMSVSWMKWWYWIHHVGFSEVDTLLLTRPPLVRGELEHQLACGCISID